MGNHAQPAPLVSLFFSLPSSSPEGTAGRSLRGTGGVGGGMPPLRHNASGGVRRPNCAGPARPSAVVVRLCVSTIDVSRQGWWMLAGGGLEGPTRQQWHFGPLLHFTSMRRSEVGSHPNHSQICVGHG